MALPEKISLIKTEKSYLMPTHIHNVITGPKDTQHLYYFLGIGLRALANNLNIWKFASVHTHLGRELCTTALHQKDCSPMMEIAQALTMKGSQNALYYFPKGIATVMPRQRKVKILHETHQHDGLM